MRIIVWLLAVAAMLSACGDADGAPTFGPDSDGDQVSVQVGDQFVIQLPGNPTTGYDWTVDLLDESILEVEDQTFAAESDALGAGGTTTFRFTALTDGTTQLRLIYERPFETAAPVDDYQLTVVVR